MRTLRAIPIERTVGKVAFIASFVFLLLVVLTRALGAQSAAVDPSARLRAVLPADVADRVLARIAEARAKELPAKALENRALKFASRGIAPPEVERAITEHLRRMESAREAIRAGRPAGAAGEEIEAGAEALRQGADGKAVSELAKSAPSGRSLAVPLFVLGSLIERGLPSDEALARVRERLAARSSDEELERLPGEARSARGEERSRGAPRGGERPGAAPRGPPEGVGRPTPVLPVIPERPPRPLTPRPVPRP